MSIIGAFINWRGTFCEIGFGKLKLHFRVFPIWSSRTVELLDLMILNQRCIERSQMGANNLIYWNVYIQSIYWQEKLFLKLI